MQSQEEPPAEQARPLPNGPPSGWPEGSEIQRVAFVATPVATDHAAQPTLLEFQEPRACRAILTSDPALSTPISGAQAIVGLTLLLVPTDEQEGEELSAAAWNWVETAIGHDRRQGQFITLQGARVVWTPGRAAIIASAARLETLRLAVVEFSFHEGEAREIEQTLAAQWPNLEADAPLAFDYDDRAALRREQLAQRFQQLVGLRSRLVRIHPVVQRPPLHPPTLAGQLAERLKERTRLVERLDFVGGQLDVFERVYEMCGQRANEFAYSRKETTLEWVIIVLLATETIVLLIDLMATLGK